MPDAVTLIKEDHKKARDLFKQFERAEEASAKQSIGEEILHELEIHSMLEQEVFYPAVEERMQQGERDMMEEAEEEHAIVDTLVSELKGMGPEDQHYKAKFTVLMENVEHHMQEEEKEMLPEAKKILGDDLEQITQQWMQRKEELMAGSNGNGSASRAGKQKSSPSPRSRTSTGSRSRS